MKFYKGLLIGIISLSLFYTLPTVAQDIATKADVSGDTFANPYVGFRTGVGNPEGDLGAGTNHAVELGYNPVDPITVAAEYSLSEFESSTANKLVRNSLMVKGAYHFTRAATFLQYTHAGLGLGPMWEDTHFGNELALGALPFVGIDYPLMRDLNVPLSIGVNVSYLAVTTDNPDVTSVNGVLKYFY